MFAPHVSPLMIGHSFEDDIVTVYSGCHGKWERGEMKKSTWELGKWEREGMECGQETRRNLCPAKANKSNVVNK